MARDEREPSSVRVLLVDDHPIVIDGLAGLLLHEPDLQVVGRALDGGTALELAETLQPDVVLLDLGIPPPAGAELIARLATVSPRTRVLILTTYDDDAHLLEAITAGAAGYLVKGAPVQQVIDGLRQVAAGESLLTPGLTAKLFAHLANGSSSGPRRDGDITGRERQVLQLLVTGASNQEIGQALYVSARTVKAHLASIFEKLEVRDRTAAAMVALRRGLVELPPAE